jgi:3D (Asp-Asp-Asp) domain-containing protein
MEKKNRKRGNEHTPPGGGFTVAGGVARVAAFALCVVVIACLMGPLFMPGGSAVAQRSDEPVKDKDELVKEVVTLDQEIGDLDARVASLQRQSNKLQGRISEIEGESARKKQELSDKRKALTARARELYINGRTSKLHVLFSSDDVSDFFKRSEVLETVAQQDTQLINEVKRQSEELDGLRSELKSKKKEVDDVSSDLESRRDRLVDNRSERQALLARAGEASTEVEQESSEVDSKIEEINRETEPVDEKPPPGGREMVMIATAYSPEEPGLTDTTASGMKAQRGVVAVDPSVIPLGTRVHVEGYGNAIAADTGSAIKGNRIDLCFDTLEECLSYGRRRVKVTILD